MLNYFREGLGFAQPFQVSKSTTRSGWYSQHDGQAPDVGIMPSKGIGWYIPLLTLTGWGIKFMVLRNGVPGHPKRTWSTTCSINASAISSFMDMPGEILLG